MNTLANPRRALVVIDVQNEYESGGLRIEYPPVADSLRHIGEAMDAAHAAGIPVIVVQQMAPADSPLFAMGSHGWDLHDVVASRPHDHYVSKTLPSAFAGTDLASWLQQRDIEMAVVKGKRQRARVLERHPLALSCPLRQIARGFNEGLAEIDAGNPAAIGGSQKARRAANARSDIQNRHVGGNSCQLGKLDGRLQPSGMKLVKASELLRREPLFVWPEGRERRLQPLDQAARAIVVAHTLKHIGHCGIPLRFRILIANIGGLPASGYSR